MIGLDFDYEELTELFRKDPAAAERRRDELIAAAIDAAPPEKRAALQRFQRGIETDCACCDKSLDPSMVLLLKSMRSASASVGEFVEIVALAKRVAGS